MGTILKYKNWLIGFGVLLLLVVLYFLFKGKATTPEVEIPSCPSSFTINPFGVVVPDVASVTYTVVNGKYFSQTGGGLLGYSLQLAPKEISKEAYMDACKKYKTQTV